MKQIVLLMIAILAINPVLVAQDIIPVRFEKKIWNFDSHGRMIMHTQGDPMLTEKPENKRLAQKYRLLRYIVTRLRIEKKFLYALQVMVGVDANYQAICIADRNGNKTLVDDTPVVLYSLLDNKTLDEVMQTIPAVTIDTLQPYKEGIPLTGIKVKVAPATPSYSHFADTSFLFAAKRLDVVNYTIDYYGASFFCGGTEYELTLFPLIGIAANADKELTAIADNNFAWMLHQKRSGKKDSIIHSLGDVKVISSHSKRPDQLIKIGDAYFGLSLQHINDTNGYLYKEKAVLSAKAQYEDALYVQKKNTVTGKLSSLRSGNGLLLLHFSGSWCVPCRTAMPYLKKVYQQQRSKLALVTIQKEKNWETARQYSKKNPLAWPSFYEVQPCGTPDSPDCLAQAFGVNAYPCYILLDEQDNVLMKEVSEDGLANIEAYLKNKK